MHVHPTIVPYCTHIVWFCDLQQREYIPCRGFKFHPRPPTIATFPQFSNSSANLIEVSRGMSRWRSPPLPAYLVITSWGEQCAIIILYCLSLHYHTIVNVNEPITLILIAHYIVTAFGTYNSSKGGDRNSRFILLIDKHAIWIIDNRRNLPDSTFRAKPSIISLSFGEIRCISRCHIVEFICKSNTEKIILFT